MMAGRCSLVCCNFNVGTWKLRAGSTRTMQLSQTSIQVTKSWRDPFKIIMDPFPRGLEEGLGCVACLGSALSSPSWTERS